MLLVPGGEFAMGCDRFYPEEAPVRRVHVDPFWMDEHPVTVAEFRRFVRETDYVTWAERPPDPAQYPDANPDLMVPGSLTFRKTAGPVDLEVWANWWAWTPGADWKHPEGPGSNTAAANGIPSRTSPTRTSRPSPRGPAARSRPRPSGSARPGAGSTAPPTRGARSSPRRAR